MPPSPRGSAVLVAVYRPKKTTKWVQLLTDKLWSQMESVRRLFRKYVKAYQSGIAASRNGRLWNGRFWRKAAARTNVRYWVNSGRHMLRWRFSAFDPRRKLGTESPEGILIAVVLSDYVQAGRR